MTHKETQILELVGRMHYSTVFAIWMAQFKSGADLLWETIDELGCNTTADLMVRAREFTDQGLAALDTKSFAKMQEWWDSEYPDTLFMDITQILKRGLE